MKKLLILLFSILISFNSYALKDGELYFPPDKFCDQSTKIHYDHPFLYLEGQTKPYSGKIISYWRIIRSLVTFAIIEAAAILILF